MNCTNSESKYYSPFEANNRVFIAIGIKDAQCGVSHKATNIIPGKAKKTDVNLCVNAILIQNCSDWFAKDPTPLSCKSINFQFDYRGLVKNIGVN